jgi:N-acyl-D-aspartate/D-glutamate deacylase
MLLRSANLRFTIRHILAQIFRAAQYEENFENDELKLDLLIRGGTVVDGSGSKPKKADIGIRSDRIVFIGKAAKSKVAAAKTLDASGMIIAPGFVDPHTHALEDLSNPKLGGNENYLMQGVTTVVTGNDGGGPVNVGETLEKWDRQGIGTNAALLVGHGSVRSLVMGDDDEQPSVEAARANEKHDRTGNRRRRFRNVNRTFLCSRQFC